MRILTITSNDLGISWGPAIHFLELWSNFKRIKGSFCVKGIAPSWTRKPPILEPGISLEIVKVPDIKAWRQVYYDIRVALYMVLNRSKFDVIYIRASHWHIFQIIALKILRFPFVLELNGLAHEDSVSAKKKRFIREVVVAQEKWLVSNARLSIAVSDGIKETVQKRYKLKGQAVTIKNGVSRAFFAVKNKHKIYNKKIKVIYVGTFTPWDGAREVPELARKFSNCVFVMVGEGPERPFVEAVSPSNVQFLGAVNYSSLPSLYEEADCAIVLYEFARHKNVKLSSLKTLEYVASCLPVFSTAVPGQEYIEEYGVGMLVHENEEIFPAFEIFLSKLSEYRSAYENISNVLQDQIGWEATAARTAIALEQVDFGC